MGDNYPVIHNKKFNRTETFMKVDKTAVSFLSVKVEDEIDYTTRVVTQEWTVHVVIDGEFMSRQFITKDEADLFANLFI